MANQYDYIPFTKEEEQFIFDNYQIMSYKEMGKALQCSWHRINTWCDRRKDILGPKKRCQKAHFKYSDQVIDYIKDHYNDFATYKELTEAVNNTFGTNHTFWGIHDLCTKSLGLKRDPSKNTGCFKTGDRTIHYNIGDEVVKGHDDNKYIWVKVADIPNNYHKSWRQKQQLVWEKYNGPIPKGMIVIFLDKNTMNCDISNLALVDRKSHCAMNRKRWYSDNKEFTKTGLAYCKLITAINSLK